MPQAVAVGAFDDSGRIHRAFQCALQNSFGNVVTLSFSAAWINGKTRGGKHILPGPLTCGVQELAPDREWQVHPTESIFEILLVLCFDSHQMSPQRLGQI